MWLILNGPLSYSMHFILMNLLVLSSLSVSGLFRYTTFCLMQIMMQILAFHWHYTTYYTAFEISASIETGGRNTEDDPEIWY